MTLSVYRRRDRHRCRVTRVWFDGVEVTNRCFYADGRRGVVRLGPMTPRHPQSAQPDVRGGHA